MKILAMLLFLGSTSVWAQPTYSELPSPGCRLVTLGNRTVIQDARGFFVGYYRPRPTAAAQPSYAPDRKPEGLYTGQSGNWSSVFSQPYMPPMPKEEAPPGMYWFAWLDGKTYTWVTLSRGSPHDWND